MKPIVTVDTSEFRKALNQYLPLTKRAVEDVVARRMFFVQARAFVAMPPQNPQAERNRIRAYLNEPVGPRRFDKKTGKNVGRSRTLQRRHLIVQARFKADGRKGLYGEEMKRTAAALSRQAIGSVGYLKSGVAKAIKATRGNFKQFGFAKKLKHKLVGIPRKSVSVDPNAFLVKIAGEYGHSLEGNVGMHKGAKAFAGISKSGASVYAFADVSWKIAGDQLARVAAIVNRAYARAFADDGKELAAEVARRLQETTEQFHAPGLKIARGIQ